MADNKIPIASTRGFSAQLFGAAAYNHPHNDLYDDMMIEHEDRAGGRLHSLPLSIGNARIIRNGKDTDDLSDLHQRSCVGFALPFIEGPIAIVREWNDAVGLSSWRILHGRDIKEFFSTLTFAHEPEHMSRYHKLFSSLTLRVAYCGRDENRSGRYTSTSTFGAVLANDKRVCNHEVLNYKTDDLRGPCMIIVQFDVNDITRVHLTH